MRTPEWVEVDDIECRQESELALLMTNRSGEEWWVPKSVIHYHSEVMEQDDVGKLIVRGWYAEKEGLAGYEFFP